LLKEIQDDLDAAFTLHRQKLAQDHRTKLEHENADESFERDFKARRLSLMRPALEKISQYLEKQGMQSRIEDTDEVDANGVRSVQQTAISIHFETGDKPAPGRAPFDPTDRKPYLSVVCNKHAQRVYFHESTVMPGSGVTSSSGSVTLDELTEELIQRKVMAVVQAVLR
jgi:hypothetical protein